MFAYILASCLLSQIFILPVAMQLPPRHPPKQNPPNPLFETEKSPQHEETHSLSQPSNKKLDNKCRARISQVSNLIYPTADERALVEFEAFHHVLERKTGLELTKSKQSLLRNAQVHLRSQRSKEQQEAYSMYYQGALDCAEHLSTQGECLATHHASSTG